jgi:hypothetical protein
MALDGNAIGGLLMEIFGAEMTSAEATCASCGAVRAVAETAVYVRGPGTVVRCRNCTSVLMVISHVRGLNCVDLSGIEVLRTVRLDDVQARRDGDATHEHAADPGGMPRTGRKPA